MPLFYGKKSWTGKPNWVGGLADDGLQEDIIPISKPRLFRKPTPALPSIDDAVADQPALSSAEVANDEPMSFGAKRQMEDNSSLPMGVRGPRPQSEIQADMPIPQAGTPKLFGERGDSTQKKPGFFKNLGISILDQFVPGFGNRITPKEQNDNRPNFQKEFEYIQGLDPQARQSAIDWKNAGSMNPMTMMKFKYDLEKDVKKEAKEALGEKVPASQAMTLAEGEILPQAIGGLRESIKKNAGAMGPIMGRLRMLNPYDKQTQGLNSEIKRVKQVVGKFLEGGVLRKEDEEKYNEILAGIGNDPDVATQKLEGLQDDIAQKYNTYLESLKNAGYNTSNFKPLSKRETAQYGRDEIAAEMARRGLK